MLVGLGLDGERLGHEADLDIGLEPPLEVGVEDPVDDRPVVVRAALGVLGVGVRRAPLQGRRAVARGQQVVRPHEDRAAGPGAARSSRAGLAIFHISIVRLIVAEEPPGGAELARRSAGVDGDRDRGLGRLPGPGEHRDGKHDRGVAKDLNLMAGLSVIQKLQQLERVGDDLHRAAVHEALLRCGTPRPPPRGSCRATAVVMSTDESPR